MFFFMLLFCEDNEYICIRACQQWKNICDTLV